MRLNGTAGVFNRFLRETGGFQFEVAYWVARWLNVPAYVVCLDPQSDDPYYDIHILSLQNGKSVNTTRQGYTDFIQGLPNNTGLFTGEVLEMPDLLQKLRECYPGISVYPYFQNQRD